MAKLHPQAQVLQRHRREIRVCPLLSQYRNEHAVTLLRERTYLNAMHWILSVQGDNAVLTVQLCTQAIDTPKLRDTKTAAPADSGTGIITSALVPKEFK